MIATKEEQCMQGGYLCDICGSNQACGDILNCAWWTSGNNKRGGFDQQANLQEKEYWDNHPDNPNNQPKV